MQWLEVVHKMQDCINHKEQLMVRLALILQSVMHYGHPEVLELTFFFYRIVSPTGNQSISWLRSQFLTKVTWALFTPGINRSPGWTGHKWSALSRYSTYEWGETCPKRCTEIQSLRPHSEVVRVTYDHIPLTACPWTCPGSNWRTACSTNVHYVSGNTDLFACQWRHIKVHQQTTG